MSAGGPPPASIGRYRILEELGAGGGGRVFKAHDPRLDRIVAIKVLDLPSRKGAADSEQFRRFLREAKAAARLQHPGIVTVYDHDTDPESGATFLVMEYVPGRSLHQILQAEKRLSLGRTAAIASQVARALHAAHGAGIVHRDIKPGNILVSGDGTAKLSDFGVARLASSELTTLGQFVGTPNYASPEQVEGVPAQPRSDLFSLGAVVFRCATGRLPFPGDSFAAIGFRISRGQALDSRQVGPELPESFHRFLRKALAASPEDRFSSGEEMARALEAVLSGDETPPTRRLTPASRSRWGAAATAIGVLLLAGVVGLRLGHRRPAAAPLAPAHVSEAAREPAGSLRDEMAIVSDLRILERRARLTVELKSHLSEETFVLEIDGKEALRKTVRVDGGLFARIGGRSFAWELPVEAGLHRVTVEVIGHSMKTRARATAGRTFAVGKPAKLLVSENPYTDHLEIEWE
jgi:serine/threonine protein kinase